MKKEDKPINYPFTGVIKVRYRIFDKKIKTYLGPSSYYEFWTAERALAFAKENKCTMSRIEIHKIEHIEVDCRIVEKIKI